MRYKKYLWALSLLRDSTEAPFYSYFTPPSSKNRIHRVSLIILNSSYSYAIRYHEDLSTHHHPTCHRLWHHRRRPGSWTYPLIQRCGGEENSLLRRRILQTAMSLSTAEGLEGAEGMYLYLLRFSYLDIDFSYSDYYIIIEYTDPQQYTWNYNCL